MQDWQEEEMINMAKADEEHGKEPIVDEKKSTLTALRNPENWFYFAIFFILGMLLISGIVNVVSHKSSRNAVPYPTPEIVQEALMNDDDYNITEAEAKTIIEWIKLGSSNYVQDTESNYYTYVNIDYDLDGWFNRWQFYVTTPTETIEFTLYYSDIMNQWRISKFRWPNRYFYMEKYGASVC